MKTAAIAVFLGPKINGHVLFESDTRKNVGANVEFYLSGFAPGEEKAIHIHEFGDERRGCNSLGGHWNPHNKNHGSILYDCRNRHAGDLINNLKANKKGKFVYKYYDPLVKVSDIFGRSVVIHNGVDDLGRGGNKESLITGNAGKRFACAIIGHVE